MYSTVGQPRRVTDAQVAIILAWNRNRRTIDDWARILGVSRGTIESSLENWRSPEQWALIHRGRRGTGRRRMLSVEEMLPLVSWRRARKTRNQFARELGLSDHTVGAVIRRGGQYKRGTAEQLEVQREAQRERLRSLDARRASGLSSGADSRTENPWVRLRAENAARFQAYLRRQ